MHAMQSAIDGLFAENKDLPSYECQIVMKNGTAWKGAPKPQSDTQREMGVLEMVGVAEVDIPGKGKTGMKTRYFLPLAEMVCVMTLEELRITPVQMNFPNLKV